MNCCINFAHGTEGGLDVNILVCLCCIFIVIPAVLHSIIAIIINITTSTSYIPGHAMIKADRQVELVEHGGC